MAGNKLRAVTRKITPDRKKYYRQIIYPEIPLDVNGVYAIARTGDRLDNIAYQFYDDVDLWWIIAAANIGVIKRDSFFIKPGTKFRIPLGHEEIVARYEELNFKTGRY